MVLGRVRGQKPKRGLNRDHGENGMETLGGSGIVVPSSFLPSDDLRGPNARESPRETQV